VSASDAINPDEFLTREELAARLKMSPRQVREYSVGRVPKIPSIWISRKTVRYHLPTVLQALSKGTP
jgi:hypothetical protein